MLGIYLICYFCCCYYYCTSHFSVILGIDSVSNGKMYSLLLLRVIMGGCIYLVTHKVPQDFHLNVQISANSLCPLTKIQNPHLTMQKFHIFLLTLSFILNRESLRYKSKYCTQIIFQKYAATSNT